MIRIQCDPGVDDYDNSNCSRNDCTSSDDANDASDDCGSSQMSRLQNTVIVTLMKSSRIVKFSEARSQQLSTTQFNDNNTDSRYGCEKFNSLNPLVFVSTVLRVLIVATVLLNLWKCADQVLVLVLESVPVVTCICTWVYHLV